jgi:hypothetical protein
MALSNAKTMLSKYGQKEVFYNVFVKNYITLKKYYLCDVIQEKQIRTIFGLVMLTTVSSPKI